MASLPRRTVEIANGLKVVVPDTLEQITPYVLIEQGDWFEDEVRFVRRLLEPGQHAIDIGANFGVYALSMARAVGPSGRVWAFEPTTATAEHLADGIAANGFANLVLDRRGISSRAGTAEISLNAHPELNEIVRDGAASGPTERIALASLDELAVELGWQGIDFVKIDAEGEESRIIEGARNFLAARSPLVQFEVKAGRVVRLDLVRQFESIGYASYRLVPGLGVLVPFDAGWEGAPSLLNLFCCRGDRAEALAHRGLLLRPADVAAADGIDLLGKWNVGARLDWPTSMAAFPYVRSFAPAWRRAAVSKQRGQVERALALFALSRSAEAPLAERHAALCRSRDLLAKAASGPPEFMRLSSLARVSRALGMREAAVLALRQLAQRSDARGGLDLTEPFLAACERFESIPPGSTPANWALAGVAEELELVSALSSFYLGPAALPRLQLIQSLGFASMEMGRRLHLVNARKPSAGPARPH